MRLTRHPWSGTDASLGPRSPSYSSSARCRSAISGQVEQADPAYDRINIQGKDYGYILKSAIWTFPADDDKRIFVCWENGSPQFDKEMGWVRQSVANTWERHSALTFRGWGACAERNAGMRIRISDRGPHVKRLGRQLDAFPGGMELNFTFETWSPECKAQREFCIRTIGVHEFGHALGFAHEQNRFDAHGECRTLKQGTDGDLLLTPFDHQSVMNYCNEKWNNSGALSKWDILSVQKLYCPRTNARCTPEY